MHLSQDGKLKPVERIPGHEVHKQPLHVFIAIKHTERAELFIESSWETTPDLVNSGWAQELRRFSGATDAGSQRFAGGTVSRAWAIPFETAFPPLDDEESTP